MARDVYGYVLNYYNTDYRNIGSGSSPSMLIPGQLGADNRPLYNGNISSMGVNIVAFNQPMLYNYQYDQLNRLVSMDAWKAGGSNWTGLAKTTDYRERVSYDPNGNIMSYVRNGDAARNAMDNLAYTYLPGKNQLDKVVDNAADVAASNYDKYNDIKKGQADGNYQYDKIGNLTADLSEDITNIEWTVYGKIARIVKAGKEILYTYDAAGNRISKVANGKTTVYVRDASGNVMSVYEQANANAPVVQTEIHLYGSSRLGMQTTHAVADVTVPLAGGATGILSTFTRGEKLFELSNHLGNVLVTVTDKKLQHTSDNATMDYYVADVATANDYYPFGMAMPGRKYAAANSYRYGFNGKENDKDISEGVQDYGMRIYDARIGKFLSVDPITKEYPELTPYQFASNKPINFIDFDGLEAVSAESKDVDKKLLVQQTSQDVLRIVDNSRANGIITHFNPNGEGEWGYEFSKTPNVAPVSDIGGSQNDVNGVFAMNMAQRDHIPNNYARVSITGIGNTFRHLMISSVLTAAFGQQMSKRITDAKEVSDMEGGGLSLDQRVDLLNNAYGRKYARENNLNLKDIATSDESTSNYLNNLVVFVLNNIPEYANAPEYALLRQGKEKVFTPNSQCVQDFKLLIGRLVKENQECVTQENKIE